jgi:hypothetical protein
MLFLLLSVLTHSFYIDDMEVDIDYESLDEEPVSHFTFFFVNYSNVMFFLWICFQYLVIHESY